MPGRGMRLPMSAVVFAIAPLLPACATGPQVMALPGSGRTFEEFNADDATCRRFAAQREGTASQRRYDMAYMQCMYAKGHRVPVAGGTAGYTPPGAPTASPGTPGVPTPPSGTPPPPPPGTSR